MPAHPLTVTAWARDMLLPIFRRPDWVAYISAFLAPVDSAYQSFYAFYLDALDRARTGPELFTIERRLNRRFIGLWLPQGPNPITVGTDTLAGTTPYYRHIDAPEGFIGFYRHTDPPIGFTSFYRHTDQQRRTALVAVRLPSSLQAREPEITAELVSYLSIGVTHYYIYY